MGPDCRGCRRDGNGWGELRTMVGWMWQLGVRAEHFSTFGGGGRDGAAYWESRGEREREPTTQWLAVVSGNLFRSPKY